MRGGRLAIVGALLLLAAGCDSGSEAKQEPAAPVASGPGATVVALNNRGVGEMGYFDYGRARETFAEVVQLAPDWLEGRVNLAIATLNRQQPGDEAAALELVSAVLATEPTQLRAHYIAGILHFNAGAIDTARRHFETVYGADPDDAYAAYFFGQCELQLGAIESALAAMEHAIDRDPYLRSAWYGAFLAEQRLGNREAARERLAAYQRLERNPRSRLAEIKYTRMGPRAEALAIRPAAPPPAGPADEPRWEEVGVAMALPGAGQGVLSGIPLVDEQHAWLALPAVGGLQVLDAAGEPVMLPFAGDSAVTALGWGDFDNDGRTDAYVGREGPDALWLHRDAGWQEVSATAGTALDGRTADVLVADADHDGDLDVFVVRADAPNELLNNNGDGTFRPLAAERGMDDAGAAGRVAAVDLDGDRDLDLLVSRPGRSLAVYLNDRLWAYEGADGPDGFSGRSFVVADLAADGDPELCGLEGERLSCWSYSDGRWPRTLSSLSLPGVSELAVADADGDSQWELIAAGEDRWVVIEADGSKGPEATGQLLAIWHVGPGAAPQYLAREPSGVVSRRAPTGANWLALAFSGREDEGASMRSNASGLGTRFVLRNGPAWTVGWLLPASSAPGAALQPALIGQPAATAEYVELDWSDGVFQTELALDPGRLHRITETQRQLASCPVLFAWDGEQYRFLSDVLGVGGIGFAVGPGEYAEPRPWEAFRIDGTSLAPLDGAFELRLTEPMEETAYVDAVSLLAIDRPASYTLLLDERMATDGTVPSGKPLFYRTEIRPVRAIDAAGSSVLSALASRDGEAAPPGPRDARFPGLLAAEQRIELHFDRDLAMLAAPVLLLDGWIEYGYSQTSFAAWQAGLGYEAPTLEALDGRGRWQVVAPHFGYPAGMPREAAYPLPALPPGTRALRIRTNQEIYFDRLAVVEAAAVPEARQHPLTLAEARLERIGFPRRSDGPQRQPAYDYADRDPFWDTRYQAGFYTRPGDARALVTELDNALAIVGPGDALVLRFDASLPPVPAGWRRDFVVRFDGWAKDMDLYTRTGETVGPLPTGNVAVDRAAALHPVFNTRFQAGR